MSTQNDNRSRTVLVVEDDELFRASLCELLSSLGVSARAVGDARAAVEALKERSFDAVITDLDLPGTGLTVVSYTRTLRPTVPVIVLTGLPEHRVPVDDVFRRLFKPASAAEIREALSEAFAN